MSEFLGSDKKDIILSQTRHLGKMTLKHDIHEKTTQNCPNCHELCKLSLQSSMFYIICMFTNWGELTDSQFIYY